MSGLEKVLFELGAPMLAKLIGQRFGAGAQDIAQLALDVLAEQFGVAPTREAVEAAIKPNQTTSVAKVRAAEERMPELLLAEAEKMRAGNEQHRLTNELLLATQNEKPAWTWAWLYVWQWVLMGIWGWALLGVHVANAALRVFVGTSAEALLPAPDLATLMTLTGLYMGLHMGGHTVLELMRGKWGGVFPAKDGGAN
ncbi:hypothetical protein SAMN02983003_3158 [Devosia enhydra]|uniref:Holin of 3TMs, for gene-transfer release n=1 Tax=Devosia enhydra TaxID=665118 RepID=A0A1K2I0S3_9HYPH|nr:hypothetical protein [Devosia enhydra]SFZ85986.1 hypothetical protein SAMN02983003_3158 [Devosia enhydra]